MMRWLALALAVATAGCARSVSSSAASTDSLPPLTAEEEAAIEARVASRSKFAPPETKKFASREEETAHWENEYIQAGVRAQETADKAALQLAFDKLSASDQASILRIRTWLPHKRIAEMDNVEDDVRVLADFPEHFDMALARRRMLEYADDSGALQILKNLGVDRPKSMVAFRIEFGQLLPKVQGAIWGITQKYNNGQFDELSDAERSLMRKRPGLFPTIYP
jgi:hypothetical protein